MAKARNVFLRSKMNKDLDARLIQNGEYRDALNIQVSQSEGSDVGVVENVRGNNNVLNYEILTGVSNLETIGYVVDQNSESVFLFLTNNTNHFIVRYTNSASVNILVEGAWLNFSTSYPIYSATIIEDLLFWTDNYNQPRKINWRSAIQFNTSSYYYYNNEQQISVAKFAPYLSPRLINLTSSSALKPSTMSNGIDLPTTIIGSTIWATKNLEVTAFRDGEPIIEAQDLTQWQTAITNQTPAWCYYNFDPSNGKTYGKIYNRFCLQRYGAGTIAPVGYKLPRESDFTSLLSSVASDTRLLKSIANSSPDDADDNYPYVPGTWVDSNTLSQGPYQGIETNNEFFDAIPTGYRRGNNTQDFINIGGDDTLNPNNFQNNAAYYWIQGASPGAEKYIEFDGSQTATGPNAAPLPSSGDYVGYYIRCIRDDDYDGWNGDPDYLKERFARFSYRFKFDDNEYSLVAPFTQTAFIPQQGGLFFPGASSGLNGDGEKTFRSTEVEFMQNFANNFVLNIPLPSGSIHRDYKVKEIDILIKESDGLSFKVLETIPVDEDFDVLYTDRTTTVTTIGGATDKFITTDAENGIIPGYVVDSIGGVAVSPPVEVVSVELDSTFSPPRYIITLAGVVTYSDGDTVEVSYSPQPIYQYNYQSLKPYKTLPEKEVVRVYDKVPVAALAQETSGNRIMYGNFVANHASVNSLDYKISAGDKSLQEDIEYPNHNIKQNRNYKVGVVLADKWGRQSDVILSKYDNLVDEFNQPEEGSNIFHAYKRDDFQPNIGGWNGDNLKINFIDIIPEQRNYAGISGYPGAYAKGSYYTTPYNGSPAVAPFRFFRQTNFSTNNTYEYQILNLFSSWSNTTYQEYFSTNKSLRGYYKDYVKINSVSYNNATNVLTIVCSNRISDDYLFEYTSTEDNLLTERTRATYTIDELGYYSYRIVVQQKQQDYYNVYLPGIINGYPINGNQDEINDTAHVVLIGDNVNKIPRDLKEVGPSQTEFNSSVKLFGRVTNSNDGSKRNEQYFPSPTADTVVLISDQKTMFGPIPDYTSTSTGVANGLCLYPGFPINYVEQQAGSTATIDVTNTITNSNPLVARISTNSGIGEVEGNWNPTSGQQYPTSMYLAVYETTPVESVLDIFWESSTTGLISDLNQAIFATADTPVAFTPNTTISINEGMTNGTRISQDFFPIDANGDNVVDTIGVLVSVFSKNQDQSINQNVNRNQEFALVPNLDGSYFLRLIEPQVALQNLPWAEFYQFNIEITLSTGETSIISLETTLQNLAPVFTNTGVCPTCTGPCFTDVDYYFSIGDQATAVGVITAENGSAKDTDDADKQELYFEILNVTMEPIGAGDCAGGTATLIQCGENGNCGTPTPPSEQVLFIQQESNYSPGNCFISINEGQALASEQFYKIRIRVTDRSADSPFGGGESTECTVAFTVQATQYTDQVVWAAYKNQQINTQLPGMFPPTGTGSGNGPLLLDGTNAVYNGQNGKLIGAVANWTGTPVNVYLAAYTQGPSVNNAVAARARLGNNNSIQNITATTFTPSPNTQFLGTIAAFTSTVAQTPSIEEGSLINNVYLEITEWQDNGSTAAVQCGLIFAFQGDIQPGAGPLPGQANYYVPGGTGPFVFEPVKITNPPWLFNSNGNFTWNGGTFS
jgi:uncharacterized protein (TIGR02145 family)